METFQRQNYGLACQHSATSDCFFARPENVFPIKHLLVETQTRVDVKSSPIDSRKLDLEESCCAFKAENGEQEVFRAKPADVCESSSDGR